MVVVERGREGRLRRWGRDDGRESQRLYQVSMGTVLDLECNFSKGFFFFRKLFELLGVCVSVHVCVRDLGPF